MLFAPAGSGSEWKNTLAGRVPFFLTLGSIPRKNNRKELIFPGHSRGYMDLIKLGEILLLIALGGAIQFYQTYKTLKWWKIKSTKIEYNH